LPGRDVDDLSKAHDHEYGVVRRDPGHRVNRPLLSAG
jgi:hypothetical protein